MSLGGLQESHRTQTICLTTKLLEGQRHLLTLYGTRMKYTGLNTGLITSAKEERSAGRNYDQLYP